MIQEIRDLQARLAALERSLQRPTQEIRDDGDLRLRWGRHPNGSWTFRAVDAAGAAAGDLVEADVVGRIVWRAIAGAPTGWMVANGQQVTTVHPVLRAALIAAGNPHGTSGGNPLLPNLIGRFARGATTPGGTGGADTVTLTSAQIPPHTHPITGILAAAVPTAAPANYVASWAFGAPENRFVGNNTGGGGAHENRPPYVDLTPLVRAY